LLKECDKRSKIKDQLQTGQTARLCGVQLLIISYLEHKME